MDFNTFWSALCARNSGLTDEQQKMTITVASFKASMRQAHDMGQKSMKPPKAAGPIDLGDLFGSSFKR